MTDIADSDALEAAAIMLRVHSTMGLQGINQAERARRTGFSAAYASRLLSNGEDCRVATLPTTLLLAHKSSLTCLVPEPA